MEIQLNVSMLKMYPGMATRTVGNSSVATAIDGHYGIDVNNRQGWDKCASSHPTMGVAHWLAIDLKGLFFVSEVRATFRYNTGENVGVFVGNNPSVTDGRYEYQCGDRLPQDNTVQWAPHIYSFMCQPAKWASHVSVQRPGTVNSPQTIFVGKPLLCTTRLVSSNATDLLLLQWLFPNGTAAFTLQSRCDTTIQ